MPNIEIALTEIDYEITLAEVDYKITLVDGDKPPKILLNLDGEPIQNADGSYILTQ